MDSKLGIPLGSSRRARSSCMIFSASSAIKHRPLTIDYFTQTKGMYMKPILTSHLGTKKSLLIMAGKAVFDPQAGATFSQCVLACEDNMVTK